MLKHLFYAIGMLIAQQLVFFLGGNKSIFNDYSLLIELCRLALCIFFQVFSYDRVYCEAKSGFLDVT